MAPNNSQKAELYRPLTEEITESGLCRKKADILFNIIKRSGAFNWNDSNNNCEDRANAVSLILDSWNIPNGKAWIFQGVTFDPSNYQGTLGGYTYHVASCILVKDGDNTEYLIIDPLMNREKLQTVQDWADKIATKAMNVFILTSNKHYQQTKVGPDLTWKEREDHFEDTMNGLTKYNNFSIWTKLKTVIYLLRKSRVVREYNSLISGIPTELSSVNCN